MLTIDIETMGLMHHKPLPPMTCACLYDGTTEVRLLFVGIDERTFDDNASKLLALLDEAPVLAGFNAVLFDLPYIAKLLDIEYDRLEGWKAKCIDPYLGMRSTLHTTCKLQRLLDMNELGSKTGSGSDAIGLARDGKLQELLDYCMMDVLLTHALCNLPDIRVTERQGIRLGEDHRWTAVEYDYDEPPPLPPVVADWSGAVETMDALMGAQAVFLM